MSTYTTLTINQATLLWTLNTTGPQAGLLVIPPVQWGSPGGPWTCTEEMLPINYIAPLTDDGHNAWFPPGGKFYKLTSGMYSGKYVYAYTNTRQYGNITIGTSTPLANVVGTPDNTTPTIDPLADWRILIKGMAAADGTIVSTNQITFNAQTLLWRVGTSGLLILPPTLWTQGTYPQGPYNADPVMIHLNYGADALSVDMHGAWFPPGGSFWKLTSGPYAGDYVYKWTNERGYGNYTHSTAQDVVPGLSTRGPGAVLATLYHGDVAPPPAINPVGSPHLAGASINYNAPGEMHFTLLVDSPYAKIPKPKQTHYAIEFWDKVTLTWVEPEDGFSGLIWDMDATETEVVFYGIDYLALLHYVIDDRFDVNNVDKGYDMGAKITDGSSYTYCTIKYIIEQEIRYAIDKPNSPVGFLLWGSAPAEMGVARTLKKFYATFRPILDMCVGLINSHRAGSGIQSRIKVVKVLDDPAYPAGCYKVRVENDPGIQKDGLALRYEPGGLIQGYRIIPFGLAWASRVDIIARQKDGLKVDYRAEDGAIPQTLWGAISQAPVLIETEDHYDLLRRARQAAADAGALGRQIGVGLKLGSFRPDEAYRICDMVPVVIQHGAIDTLDWSGDVFAEDPTTGPVALRSGYWAINGITWETYDDGHWMTGLSLYPRNIVPKSKIDCTFNGPASTVDGWNSGLDINGNWLTAGLGDILTAHIDLTGLNAGSVVADQKGVYEWVSNDAVLNATGNGPVINALNLSPKTNPDGGTWGNSNYAWGFDGVAFWWPNVVNSGVDARWVWDITDKKVAGICTIALMRGEINSTRPLSIEASDDGTTWHTVFTTNDLVGAIIGGTWSGDGAILQVPADEMSHTFWAVRYGPHYFPRAGVSYDGLWETGGLFMMWEALVSSDVRA